MFLLKIPSIARIKLYKMGWKWYPATSTKMLKPPVSGIQGFRSQQEADLKTRICDNTPKEEKKKDDGNRNSFLRWSMDGTLTYIVLELPAPWTPDPALKPLKINETPPKWLPWPDQNGLTLQKWWISFGFVDPKNMRWWARTVFSTKSAWGWGQLQLTECGQTFSEKSVQMCIPGF